MEKIIILEGREINYELLRKKVKNINLRIKSDGSMFVSANNRVPEKRIEEFLLSNSGYILKAIDKFKSKVNKPIDYSDGENIRILGESFPIKVIEGKLNLAFIENGELVLTVKDTTDIDIKKKTADSFIKEICREATLDACEKIYPVFEKMGVKYPTVKFRKMHTKWGICRPERKEVTFSYMLGQVPIECIEYVVYHEFCHFLHPNHSKRFYDLLTNLLPDWKERKKRLESVAIGK